jgi:MoaA/NifB/PqqE/SkfB family radical SAM enzyme
MFDARINKIAGIDIMINKTCNLNCKMCEINSRLKHLKYGMAPEHIFNLLSQFKEYNPDGVVKFDTGEIFADRKTISPLLEYCTKIGLKLGIVTNGTLMNEADIELVKENLSFLVIALESSREDVHDFMRGRGTYKKVVKLLSILNSKGIKYSVNTVVNKLNIDHLLDLYLFLTTNECFLRHDLNLLTKSFYIRKAEEDRFYNEYGFSSARELRAAEKKLLRYMKAVNGRKTSYLPAVHKCVFKSLRLGDAEYLDKPACNIFHRKLIVDYDGAVRLCYERIHPPVGNIADGNLDLKRLWESDNTRRIRNQMERCLRSCGLIVCNNKEIPYNQIP